MSKETVPWRRWLPRLPPKLLSCGASSLAARRLAPCGDPKVVMLQPLKVPFSEMFLQRAWNGVEDPTRFGIWLGDAKP